MRIFVAIFPPPEVQNALHQAARAAPLNGNLRWLRPENIHLTLKFLGDVAPEDLEGVRNALGRVAKRHEAFRVEPAGIGAFPSDRKARVLWAGVDKGSAALSKLAEDVEEMLEPLGFGRERKRYNPHATLGRVRGRLARLPDSIGVRAPTFTARRLDLVESLLGATGATYRKLESYPFPESPRRKSSNREQRSDSHNYKEE